MSQPQMPISPGSTLSRIARTLDLSTREKLQLFSDLRRQATRLPLARAALGFDANDVDREIDHLRRRVWWGIGPRVERQGDLR